MTYEGNLILRHQRGGGVAEIIIDRPAKKNAITWQMRARMEEIFQGIDRDDTVRAVVIRGAGEEAFSSGGDVAGFLEHEPHEFVDLGENLCAPERSPKPVIAAIDGFCLGAGLELAMSCDIRIATTRAEFGQPEIRLGMIPGSGGTQRLSRLIGLTRAKDMILTGRRISSRQALDWGLVTSVVEPPDLDEEVNRYLDMFLTYSPLALKLAKQVINKGAEAPLSAALEMERKAYSLLRGSHDYVEGVRAFLERRDPTFEGR